MLTGAAVANYLLAQPEEQLSDLTLANIEAMSLGFDQKPVGVPCKYTGNPLDFCAYIITTTDGAQRLSGLSEHINI